MSAKTSRVTANARPSPKAPGTAKPVLQLGLAELDAVHRKAIESFEAAGKAMSVARATIEVASSKEDRKKAVARAGKVVGPLLVPSRHVVKLLSGLDALFPLCKQVSKTLAVLTKHEVNQHAKDVRVAIVHFDLAIALVHIGSLNRESRPAKSIADPLSKLLKDFKGVIQEFNLFCEAYYKSVLKHLPHRKLNKDKLNSFATRIALLKRSLTSLLSQQAVQHPGKHADVLAQIESRQAKDRAFYAINEEIAEAFLSKQLKQGGEASVRLDGHVLKQSTGTVGQVRTHGISSAKTKTTASTLKQAQKQVAKARPDAKPTRGPGDTKSGRPRPDAKPTRGPGDTKSGRPRPDAKPTRGPGDTKAGRPRPDAKPTRGPGDTKSGRPRPDAKPTRGPGDTRSGRPRPDAKPTRGPGDTKSGRPRPDAKPTRGPGDAKSGRPRPNAKPTRGPGDAKSGRPHAPARGQPTGQQQKKGTSENGGKLQTPRDVAGGQELYCLQEDEEIADGLEVDGEEEEEVDGEVEVDEEEEVDGEVEVDEEEEVDGEVEVDEEEEVDEEVEVDEDGYPYPPEDGSEEEGADSADSEQENEFDDSEEGGLDSADPEQEDEFDDSEEEGEDSADPEQDDELEDSEEGGADSADPELEDEFDDSEEGGEDSADPEEDDEGDDNEEGGEDSADPEQEDEGDDSEEGGADSADPEQEDGGDDSEPGDEED